MTPLNILNFGFGNNFICVVQTLYNDINSCVSLSNGNSPRCYVSRGIRQRDPIYPFLFLVAAELLILYVVNGEVEAWGSRGIMVRERVGLVTQRLQVRVSGLAGIVDGGVNVQRSLHPQYHD